MSATPEKTYCSILVRSFHFVDGQRVYEEQSPEIICSIDGEEPARMTVSRDRAIASVRDHLARLADKAEDARAA